jgi:hypothetical protein
MHIDFVKQEYSFQPNHVMFHKLAFEELALNRQSLAYTIDRSGNQYYLQSGYDIIEFKNEDIMVYGAILQFTALSRFTTKTFLEIGRHLNFPMVVRDGKEVECRKVSQACKRLVSSGYLSYFPSTITNVLIPHVRCRTNNDNVFEEFGKDEGFRNFLAQPQKEKLFGKQEKVTQYQSDSKERIF